jgi:hypothetical protein
MANYLQMPKKQQVLALLELGWSHRRIQRETGVHRETVAEYDRARLSNPAKTFPGSAIRRRFTAAPYRTTIAEKLDAGLTLQRIWQDLVEEFGYPDRGRGGNIAADRQRRWRKDRAGNYRAHKAGGARTVREGGAAHGVEPRLGTCAVRHRSDG